MFDSNVQGAIVCLSELTNDLGAKDINHLTQAKQLNHVMGWWTVICGTSG
jgi:hypothetical protein